MSKGKLFNRFNQVKSLIETYEYPNSLSRHLKSFLRSNKQFGSKDRKQIKQWFYAYFKLAILAENLEEELWLTLDSDTSDILNPLRELSDLDLEKAKENSFPLVEQVSKDFKQIDDLITEKPIWHHGQIVKQDILDSYMDVLYAYNQGVDRGKEEGQIQDLASFQASELVAKYINESPKELYRFWDACCGAGGKSLALSSLLQNLPAAWLMSDRREAILPNAKKRFTADLRKRIQFGEIDLLSGEDNLSNQLMKKGQQYWDGILLDVPCSGSGTWGRNPQHLRFFNKDKLNFYSDLQQQIISGTVPFLSEDSVLFYVTCSVYSKENEEQVQFMQDKLGLELKEQKYLGQANSDTLFIAVLGRK